MAMEIATTIRRRARTRPQHTIAAELQTNRSRVGRVLRRIDDLAAVLAALDLVVVARG